MAPESNRARVIVFAKAPRPGQVKTRLVPRLGANGAAALHARLIERTLRIAKDAAVGPVDLYGDPADDPFLRDCAARFEATLLQQNGPDLGARMDDALATALRSAGAAIVIGTDCPPLQAEHLRHAAGALLGGHDAVVAPVEDGGYALIGLARPESGVFENVSWSTDTVMEETRTRLRNLGLRWIELPTLWDLDRPADYERFVTISLREPGNYPGAQAPYIG